MAQVNSVEYAIASAPPVSTPLDPSQDKGRVRISHFDFTAITTGATDTLFHCRLPAGKVRVLAYKAKRTAFAAGATMSLGHNGYTTVAGVAVAASATAFLAAQAMDVTTDMNLLIDVAITSRGGFDVYGQMAVGAGTAENLIGWIEYVVD